MAEPTQIIVAENWEYLQVVENDDRTTGVGSTAIASLCALPKWIVPNPDCGLTTAQIAAKDIPDGIKFEIIDIDKYNDYCIGIGSTAMDLTGAVTSYNFDTKQCTYDLTKAKKLAHRKRRNRRYSEFAPHDSTVAKAIPGTTDAAEASRVGIRSTYTTMQTEIDDASTIDELYAILQKYPSRPIPREALESGYDRTPIFPHKD
tara:strand:+ start:454 stop:1062 length:609 start_codon:yes stop_codon:yes gene_type:complete